MGMLQLQLTFLAIAALARHPPPPRQSRVQAEYVEALAARAHLASEAARPALLAYLDTKRFRDVLVVCCSSIAQESSAQLLTRLESGLRVTELTHNFHTNAAAATNDQLNISLAASLTWFPNQWTLQQQRLLEYRMNRTSRDLVVMETAEVGIFGAMPFSTLPPTLFSEATDRPIYTAFNALNLDTCGSPHFGAACAVFNRSYLGAGTVVIAAADSGLYEFTCNASGLGPKTFNSSLKVNCSAWVRKAFSSFSSFSSPPVRLRALTVSLHPVSRRVSCACPENVLQDPHALALGTLDDFLHLLLPNTMFWSPAIAEQGDQAGSWADPIAIIFRRWFGADKRIADVVHLSYLESNIFAAPRFPHGVKMMVATFGALFGNSNGTALRKWCVREGWLLLWAVGDGLGAVGRNASTPHIAENATFAFDHRLLDPHVAMGTREHHNVTTTAAAVRAFARVWQRVNASAGAVIRSDPGTSAHYRKWWTQLEAVGNGSLVVQPLLASSCAAPEARCVGTTKWGSCLCYHY